jgi:Zn-dependent protease
MFSGKELLWLLLGALLLGYVAEFQNFSVNISGWASCAVIGAAILLIHVCAQKLLAYKFGCNAEFELWNVRQWGFKKSQYFKRPVPAWLLLPLLLVWISFGAVKWLGITAFDAAPSIRAGKRFSELTEWELGLIALSGSIANLFFAVLFQFLGFHNFAMLNAWLAFFSLVPISSLDGVKVFFGGKFFWLFNFILTTIALILIGISSLTTTILAAAALLILLIIFFFVVYEAS